MIQKYNPDISPEELEYRVQPLTKDDLSVEADGWLQILKKHVGSVSEVQIEDYESHITAISGVEVDVSDAGATWTVITDWLLSAEGGLRWAKNIGMFTGI